MSILLSFIPFILDHFHEEETQDEEDHAILGRVLSHVVKHSRFVFGRPPEYALKLAYTRYVLIKSIINISATQALPQQTQPQQTRVLQGACLQW